MQVLVSSPPVAARSAMARTIDRRVYDSKTVAWKERRLVYEANHHVCLYKVTRMLGVALDAVGTVGGARLRLVPDVLVHSSALLYSRSSGVESGDERCLDAFRVAEYNQKRRGSFITLVATHVVSTRPRPRPRSSRSCNRPFSAIDRRVTVPAATPAGEGRRVAAVAGA